MQELCHMVFINQVNILCIDLIAFVPILSIILNLEKNFSYEKFFGELFVIKWTKNMKATI